MSQFIQQIEAVGLHGRFDVALTFTDGINIVHGSNGTGKTTLLHILANAVNGDFRRFAYLKFQNIIITLDDQTQIKIAQKWSNNPEKIKTEVWIGNKVVDSFQSQEVLREETQEMNEHFYQLGYYSNQDRSLINLKSTYFPAFRTMIEAWSTLDKDQIRSFTHSSTHFKKLLRNTGRSTELARILFGKFVPRLQYPSPIQIEKYINKELIKAQLKIARTDRNLFSDAFVESFKAIAEEEKIPELKSENLTEMIENIKNILERLEDLPFQIDRDQSNDVYKKLKEQLSSFQIYSESQAIAKRFLSIYQNSLQKRLDQQTEAYAKIEKYLESVNQFLEGKKLEIQMINGQPKLGVKIKDESSIHSLKILSSGERQVVGLIYSASHQTYGKIVLIDEPEISLHIDWQRKLLPEMMKQLGNKQLIICTHSPVIASAYRERMIELELQPTSHPNLSEIESELESELDDELDDEYQPIPF